MNADFHTPFSLINICTTKNVEIFLFSGKEELSKVLSPLHIFLQFYVIDKFKNENGFYVNS